MRIYNDTLNPDIWSPTEELQEDIRNQLLKIAYDFYKDSELTVPIHDVQLLGSNANFNWTPTSDLDVHLVIDFGKLEMPEETAKEFANLLKYKWNEQHDIHIKTYNVETYIQDIKHVPNSTGIFSILNNQWITKPQKEKVVLDKPLIQQKYQDLVKRIQSAIKENNLESMKTIIKDIYDYRQAGLDRAGEFSTENVVFKLLRSKNHIDDLRTALNKEYDKENSIP